MCFVWAFIVFLLGNGEMRDGCRKIVEFSVSLLFCLLLAKVFASFFGFKTSRCVAVANAVVVVTLFLC